MVLFAGFFPVVGGTVFADNPPYIVTYLWHMHQPIYYPYVNINDSSQYFNFSVPGVFDGDRTSAYTVWPKDAVQQGADRNMDHAGAQVSYSGSLAENANNLWGFNGNTESYRWARNGLRTTLNNPRLDTVGIAYHHSLMPLTCKESMIMQIKLHKEQYMDRWDASEYSKGFWPPECAFDESVIPALVEEGLEWVIVDNGHLFRTVSDFPWNSASSCRPNPADMVNGSSTDLNSQWVGLQNVWAPTKVLAPWSYQPHYVQYVDPNNGNIQKIIAVPAGRYEGNENGRGGYGSFKPENVWGSITGVNTDPSSPMLILCHSDGDNYGMKNSDAWNGQHGLFLDMCQGNASFDHWSVQDYLDTYPPSANDVIHVEPGSWIGIDGGTPYYEKWLSKEEKDGRCPDYWSWSVLVAAQNRVLLADALENSYSMNDVEWGIGSDTAKAWHWYLAAETSCYWYWDYDTANPWDGNVTRACNVAVAEAQKVIDRHPGGDTKGPAIFPPQRDIYNPGSYMWDEAEPASSDFTVWSFVDDVSGLQSVKLYWRTDKDGFNPVSSIQNETYAGGGEVNAWNSQDMTGSWFPANKGPDNIVPDPAVRAQMYQAMITGQSDVLIDYYIEATDTEDNVSRSNIRHVYVGEFNGPQNYVEFDPAFPNGCNPVTIKYKKTDSDLAGSPSVYIHVGRNDWQDVEDHQMSSTDPDYWTYTYSVPADTYKIVCAFSNLTGTLDNNTGADYQVVIANCDTNTPSVNFVPAAPQNCEPVLIQYSPGSPANGVLADADPVYAHVGYNGWQGSTDPDPVMTNNNGVWEYLYYPPVGAFQVNVCFNNGGAIWENNNGSDYGVTVAGCESTNAAVTFSPAVPSEEQNVSITYNASGRTLSGVNPVYITVTCDGWGSWDHYAMTSIGADLWSYSFTVPNYTERITVNFRDTGEDSAATTDDNAGNNWAADVNETPDTNVLMFVAGSPAISSAGTPNNAGDNFDLTVAGAAAKVQENGFGSFGKVYVNYDETNLYLGAYDVDTSGDNNGLILFLSTDTLDNDAENLWNCSGDPAGLDILHNIAFYPPVDMAILLGDDWGDGNFSSFNLASGDAFGQGVFSIETGSFLAVTSARLSQFDGAGTTPCASEFDADPDRTVKRWECAIPWTALNAPAGLGSITNAYLSGIFVSERTTNETDRYLSSSTLGISASGETDEFGNYAMNFVTLNGQPIGMPDVDLDGDGVADNWKRQHFGDSYVIDPATDFDGDGFCDVNEYLAGTDPKNDSSIFEFLPAQKRGEQALQIQWSSVPGWRYDLLMSTNLFSGEFAVMQSDIAAGGSLTVITGSVDGVENAYYKVRTRRP
jgi:hypothetical protein